MTALAFKLDSAPSLFEADFARNASALPGAGLPWLDARRRAAVDAFAKTGVPTRRVEAWKYTDLANALESDLEPVNGVVDLDGIANPFGVAPGAEIVLSHGFLQQVSNAGGLDIVNLSALDAQTPGWIKDHLGLLAAGKDQPLGAASLALMRGGVAVRVQGQQSLSLQFGNPALERDAVSHARVLIVVEEGASLRLLESHSGDTRGQRFANIGVELVLKSGARLDHVRLQAEDANTLHVTTIGASLGRDAEYRALYAAMGARLSRVDMNVKLAAQGAHATLHSIAVLNSGIADITTVMDHAAPHTTSRQLFKSVVGGRGRSVTQGRVSVRKGALKSDSHQLFKALLLSPRAEADAKPELEIFADDVICGHGTAIGALDADALFYLRTRGIPEEEAKGLLVRAFLEDAMEGFAEGAVHDVLANRVGTALASLEQAEP
jgi:Fe-S cluster assembly protein SufD